MFGPRSTGWQVSRAVSAIGPVVFVSVAAAIVFAGPAQIRDIYQVVSENTSFGIRELVTAAVAFLILSGAIWYSSFSIMYLKNQTSLSANRQRRPSWILVVVITTSLPTIGLIFGLVQTFFTHDRSGIATASALLLAIPIVMILLVSYFCTSWFVRNPAASEKITRDKYQYTILIGTIVVVIFMFIFGRQISVWIGSLAIIALFFAFLAIVLAQLSWRSRFIRPSLISIVALLVVLFAYFDLNNNHNVRLIEARETPWEPLGAFDQWLASRVDKQFYVEQGKKYPVYLVAAEGGGMYAAYHAAVFLSRIQDLCPSFSSHVFAISSVSGGSLGAGLFSALIKDSTGGHEDGQIGCRPDTGVAGGFERRAKLFLSRDFLSPILAAGLFSDALQALSPVVMQGKDRAWAMEASFEDAWQEVAETDGSIFGDDFLSLYDPTKAVPSLIINTTQVESGGPRPIGHIRLADDFYSLGLILDNGTGPTSGTIKYSVRLSTAIGLSARFPWISPAGRINPELPTNVVGIGTTNIVDGGYFEGSGTEAIAQLIGEIEMHPDYNDIDLRVVTIQSLGPSENPAVAFHEVASPVRTMLNARQERGRASRDHLSSIFCGRTGGCDEMQPNDQPVWYVYIGVTEGELPLGWRLSVRSQLAVEREIGYASQCLRDADGQVQGGTPCILSLIGQQLDGRSSSRSSRLHGL